MPAAAYALQDTNNNRIREIDLKSGETTTLASTGIQGFSDGVGTSVQFSKPYGIAIDPQGAFALVDVRACGPHPRVAPSRERRIRLPHTPHARTATLRRRLSLLVHRVHALCTCMSGPRQQPHPEGRPCGTVTVAATTKIAAAAEPAAAVAAALAAAALPLAVLAAGDAAAAALPAAALALAAVGALRWASRKDLRSVSLQRRHE